ncbi:hypothetical protein FVE85_6118 [Porphyridium purpureum]|uniref:Exocyst complex component EXOC6/Sec15 N-terminal domain-containing protein n=1 Tax=Porphyridium purpureum TaxID=35688 RepID=A0A5J4Z6R8_PORPP|nr:hypothetical protein FVE85_6118 [Porphyridium purpureum]|eukprot:POR4131..scf295_1
MRHHRVNRTWVFCGYCGSDRGYSDGVVVLRGGEGRGNCGARGRVEQREWACGRMAGTTGMSWLPSQQEPEDQMVLAAARAVYQNDEADAVRDLLDAKISAEAQQMVRTVKRNSRKVEHEVGKLLRARQDIHDMEDRLLTASAQAEQLALSVSAKQDELQAQMQISANIVKVVRLIQVLKRMMRIYGEAREYVKELRLHMALKSVHALRVQLHEELGVFSITELDAETAAFIPDPAVIEALVEQKCDAMFDKWVSHVIAVRTDIGRYAIAQIKSANSSRGPWLPAILEDSELADEHLGDTSGGQSGNVALLQLDVRNVVQCAMLYADLGRTKKLENAYGNMMQFLVSRALMDAQSHRAGRTAGSIAYQDARSSTLSDYDVIVTLVASVLGLLVIDTALREQLELAITPRARLNKLWLDAESALSDFISDYVHKEMSLVSRLRLKGLVEDTVACANDYKLSTPTLAEIDLTPLSKA